MPYVKALFTGLGAAIGAAVLWIHLLAAFIGFVIGTWWGMRRFVVAN